MAGIITSLTISPGGVPKLPIAAADVTAAGVAGDRQRNLKLHGGPDRAVSLLSGEVLRELQAAGHPIVAGSTGENLVIDGLGRAAFAPGVRLRLGASVELELTSWLAPCSKIAGCFLARDIAVFKHARSPGSSRIGARVLCPGRIQVGDAVHVIG
jgi:MOSC domain-containing protein YiiM